MLCERDRGTACDAYAELLMRTAAGDDDVDPPLVGRCHGHRGRVGRWDHQAARLELARLALLAGQGPLRLDCSGRHCGTRRCHAHSIAEWLRRGWVG